MAGRRAPRSLPAGERQECLGSAFLESTHPSPPLLWVSLRSLQPPDSGQRKGGGVTHSQLRDQMGSEKATGGFQWLCLGACEGVCPREWLVCVLFYQWGRFAPWLLGC